MVRSASAGVGLTGRGPVAILPRLLPAPMRLVLPLLGLVLVAGCAASPPSPPPDTVLADLEARLVAAPHVSFTVTTVGEGETVGAEAYRRGHRLEATFAFGPDGRLAVASTGEVNEIGASPGLISDGTTMRGGRGGAEAEWPDVEGAPVPADLRSTVVAQLLHRGATNVLMTLVQGAPLGLTEDPELGEPLDLRPATGFAWGPAEAVDGRRARPLRFRAPTGEVVMWLDAETGLPVRRTEVQAGPAGTLRITEAYADWSFDPAG